METEDTPIRIEISLSYGPVPTSEGWRGGMESDIEKTAAL
ncbi:hypothetical protein SBDP1_590033 [Syntrophobacter sp. SbD1]|nr:hypothetical protein SBDP1_590033 [Syntrophobacter sp. SbD1]